MCLTGLFSHLLALQIIDSLAKLACKASVFKVLCA